MSPTPPPPMTPEQQRELQELLLDLGHDLGKYLRLPLAMLPTDAAADDVRHALQRALQCTRKSPRGVRSARELYRGFLEELDALSPGARDDAAFSALEDAVQGALAWERALAESTAVDRARALSDLSAVGSAIGAWLERLRAIEGDHD